jgi:hypothetical protein
MRKECYKKLRKAIVKYWLNSSDANLRNLYYAFCNYINARKAEKIMKNHAQEAV